MKTLVRPYVFMHTITIVIFVRRRHMGIWPSGLIQINIVKIVKLVNIFLI